MQLQMDERFDCVGFESVETGQWIINPFRDPTDRFDVDPLEEYTEEELLTFLHSYDVFRKQNSRRKEME